MLKVLPLFFFCIPPQFYFINYEATQKISRNSWRS